MFVWLKLLFHPFSASMLSIIAIEKSFKYVFLLYSSLQPTHHAVHTPLVLAKYCFSFCLYSFSSGTAVWAILFGVLYRLILWWWDIVSWTLDSSLLIWVHLGFPRHQHKFDEMTWSLQKIGALLEWQMEVSWDTLKDLKLYYVPMFRPLNRTLSFP